MSNAVNEITNNGLDDWLIQKAKIELDKSGFTEVGLDDIKSIREQLDNAQTVSVSGLSGSGKTTLEMKLINELANDEINKDNKFIVVAEDDLKRLFYLSPKVTIKYIRDGTIRLMLKKIQPKDNVNTILLDIPGNEDLNEIIYLAKQKGINLIYTRYSSNSVFENTMFNEKIIHLCTEGKGRKVEISDVIN